ncbi:MAG TPA: hypothetical protein DDW20_01500 [Firmicutes bacterium]|nr:hypothetical protein [Bacillota bacterium]
MELDFINNGKKEFDNYEFVFNELMKKTFLRLNIKSNYVVDVTICDNAFIHEINRDYRGVDRPTDVISFAFFDDKEEKASDIIPTSLGEIIISYEKAEEQAVLYGHTVKREMSFLFVHGLLHLLGYDHMKTEDEKIMFGLQNEILGGHMMEVKELVEKAIEARKLAYTPYSHFNVGAAILCKDGEVFLGANIENSSYPLCMCAERNAIYNAYLHGKTKNDFVALALAADTEGPCSPCGACRQVISELFPSEAPIYMANIKGLIQETNAKELLPFAFSGDDLK